MKKILSIILLMTVIFATFTVAQAAPAITTEAGREICLEFPEGEFHGDVFMVPVRRICDVFSATCDWYEEDRKIIINSKDNITRIFLYIDKPTYRIFTFTGLLSGEGVNYELAAPLKIVQDRTMVPLEQLCQALNGSCTWNQDKSQVVIKTGEIDPERKVPGLYIQSDATDVNKDDTVVVNIKANNLQISDSFSFSGYTAGLIYNKKEFEFVSCTLTDNEGNDIESLNMENLDFTEDSIKLVRVLGLPIDHVDKDALVGRVVLKALTDNGGEIRISSRIYTIGDDTSVVYVQRESSSLVSIKDGLDLKIDTNPVSIK